MSIPKIRIHEVGKMLGVKSTELLELLKDIDPEAKNHMSTLSEMDLNIILEHYTKLYDDGSDLAEFLNAAKKEKEAAAPKEENVPQKEETAPTEPEIEAPKGKQSRYVDTRPSVVDLDHLETEKIEELVPTTIKQDTVVNKQKLKKGNKKRRDNKPNIPVEKTAPAKEKKQEKREVTIPEEITVGDLAEKLGLPATEIIKRLMLLGVMAAITQTIDFDTASLIADDLGVTLIKEIIVTEEDKLFNDTPDAPEDLIPRPPVVVVMGHVDHGKTSLLDAIRETHVIETEAGGITQHIGAYTVKIDGKPITFLDTPGHEAFTAMRARGAQVTDIAILVVAADDGIMPQTVEAINHAKAAGVTIIVAINKIDKEGANPQRVMQELTEHEIVPEDWGGDTVCVEVSAKKRINIDGLLEMITLTAELKELKANPNRMAKGTVIESKLDKGRGPVATVLVQNGTLKIGDVVVAGTAVGRVRAMLDDKGKRIQSAGPSVPVEIVGLSETPDGGDLFYAVDNERAARNVVEARKQKIKDESIVDRQAVSLDDLFAQIQDGEVKDLNLIVKADVQGSVEAVKQSLERLSNDEVRVRVIHGAVGGIRESDVMLASASNAIIVGFNVRPDSGALASASMKKVDIRLYSIIYNAIEEIEAAMKGMLAPTFRESVIGHVEVRQTFKVSSVGTIAGCYVTDGKITRNCSVRVVRDDIVIYEGELGSLKRFKDDVKEVAAGYECGMNIERFNDIKEGDTIEAYVMEEVAR